MGKREKMSRRKFLGAAMVTAMGAAVAACQPKTVVVEKQVEVEKEVTKVVKEVVKETVVVAGTPKVVEKEVTKVIKETVVVEKPPAEEVIVLQPVLRTDALEQELEERMFDVFREEHPNIKVNPIYVPGAELDQKTDLMIAAGTPPDLWFPGAGRGNRYYADIGQLMVLDPFLEEEDYDLSDFYERALWICQWAGHYQSLPIDQNTMFFCYNKDLFDEAGLEYPPTDWEDDTWTWDKFLEVCKALTKEENGKIVQYGTSTGYDTSRFASWVFGGDWFDEQSNKSGYAEQFLWRRDQVEAGLQYTADLMNVHHVMPTPEESQTFAPGIPLHMTGRIGLWAAHTSNLLGYKEITEFDWGVCAVPRPPELPPRIKAFMNQWMIFRGSLHPKEAWMLMRHMMTVEMMKIYPVEKGRLPARKSLDAFWWEWLNEILPHLTAEELTCIRGSAEIAYPTSSFSMVHFAEFWGKALQPELDKLWLGEITAQEAVANMIPVMKDITDVPEMKVEGES